MWLIVLEALAALSILLLAVWWTMFSGRKRGERGTDAAPPAEPGAADARGNAERDRG
jgi:hypothetical protein